MSCAFEFPNSTVQVEFHNVKSKQKILIDVLTKHGDIDLNKLAFVLDISTSELKDISNGNGFLTGEQADSLAQIFLNFLGKNFFPKSTLIRNFIN